jgi:Plasmid pRiA4b ORF-3-like protein
VVSYLLPPVIYQLKVSLARISSMIWRRVRVQSDMTLSGLHQVIQISMGWEDCHLHAFRIHGRCFFPRWTGERHCRGDGREVLLSDLGLRIRQKLFYTYDFGDCWEHDVRVEARRDRDPRKDYRVCTNGKRACPGEGRGAGQFRCLRKLRIRCDIIKLYG